MKPKTFFSLLPLLLAYPNISSAQHSVFAFEIAIKHNYAVGRNGSQAHNVSLPNPPAQTTFDVERAKELVRASGLKLSGPSVRVLNDFGVPLHAAISMFSDIQMVGTDDTRGRPILASRIPGVGQVRLNIGANQQQRLFVASLYVDGTDREGGPSNSPRQHLSEVMNTIRHHVDHGLVEFRKSPLITLKRLSMSERTAMNVIGSLVVEDLHNVSRSWGEGWTYAFRKKDVPELNDVQVILDVRPQWTQVVSFSKLENRESSKPSETSSRVRKSVRSPEEVMKLFREAVRRERETGSGVVFPGKLKPVAEALGFTSWYDAHDAIRNLDVVHLQNFVQPDFENDPSYDVLWWSTRLRAPVSARFFFFGEQNKVVFSQLQPGRGHNGPSKQIAEKLLSLDSLSVANVPELDAAGVRDHVSRGADFHDLIWSDEAARGLQELGLSKDEAIYVLTRMDHPQISESADIPGSLEYNFRAPVGPLKSAIVRIAFYGATPVIMSFFPAAR